jgi:hypothetical protein
LATAELQSIYEEIEELRLIHEVADARYNLLSHIPHTSQLSPKEEAAHIFHFLSHGIVIREPGTVRPVMPKTGIISHNIAVARELRKLEARAQHKMVVTQQDRQFKGNRVSGTIRELVELPRI